MSFALNAQIDSTLMLNAYGPEVSIEGAISEGTSLTSLRVDETVADILSYHKGIHIQSQGGSYLQTAYYRGQSARHMAILWQGVNIQNTFNGTYDLGLIQSTLFQNSKWFDGGQSANIGTAAMSGVLVLEDRFNKERYSLGLHYNDQDNKTISVGLLKQVGRVSHSMRSSIRRNENAFRYQVRDEIFTRNNSRHNQVDLSYGAAMQWNLHSRTTFNGWYQRADRMLAPSIIASNQAQQNDRNLRLSLGQDWEMTPNMLWSTKVAYMSEYLAYRQPSIESIAQSDIVNLNSKLKVDGWIDHTFGMSVRYENAELADTINPTFNSFYPTRTTSAFYYNGKKKWRSTILSVSLRQEAIDKVMQTPTGQVGMIYRYSEQLSYTFNLGRHYNYPGFNDLYWPIGGNVNLSNEQSWQLEAGFSYVGFDVKIYKIYTDNKILWAPNELSIWTPQNIASTSASGLEVKYNSIYKLSDKFEFTFIPIINYNHTVNTAEGLNQGKELLYNPKFTMSVNAILQYNKLSLSLSNMYTGRRFQSLDNIEVLDGYNLMNAEIKYEWNRNNKFCGDIYFGTQNLLNQKFELVRFFPQPLRSIYFGANFSI